jgi:fibronectin-binding autotransporter adhesin
LPIRPFSARPFVSSRLPLSCLLATTSVAALLFAVPTGAIAGPGAGQTVNGQTVATVTNAAGQSITSIIIRNSTVTGAVTNAGTITPGRAVTALNTAAIFVAQSSVGGGVLNTGTISSNIGINGTGEFPFGIEIANTVLAKGAAAGALVNSGTITATGRLSGVGVFLLTNVISGDVSNTGSISATGADNAFGIALSSSTLTGNVSNTGTVTSATTNLNNLGGDAFGIFVSGGTITGSVVNGAAGVLNQSSIAGNATGIVVAGASVSAGVMNLGAIKAQGVTQAAGIHLSSAFGTPSSIGGGVANNGTISATASSTGQASGITVGITPNGFAVADQVSGGITNPGTITVSAGSAFGILTSTAAQISGGITNSGTIIANGVNSGTGIQASSVADITNTGTIFGSSGAINLLNANGVTVTQAAGALIGSVRNIAIAGPARIRGAAIAIASNVLNVTGGALSLQPTSTVSGFGIVNQSGGNILLQVTPSNTAGNFPTVTAGNLSLSGVLEVGPQSGSFAAGQTITYSNVFNATGILTNNVTSVQVFDFFSTGVTAIFPGFSDALSSSNGGYTAQAFGEAGYRVDLAGARFGWLGLSRAYVEPFAGAAAFLIHQNGFTEGGGASALTGFARDFNIQTTTLGVRSELAFASLPVSVTTMLGWRHAYGDVVPSVLLAFQGGAQSFSSSGVPIDRDAFVAEAGVNYAVTSSFTVGLSYAGQFGQRATDNAFKGHLDLSF